VCLLFTWLKVAPFREFKGQTRGYFVTPKNANRQKIMLAHQFGANLVCLLYSSSRSAEPEPWRVTSMSLPPKKTPRKIYIESISLSPVFALFKPTTQSFQDCIMFPELYSIDKTIIFKNLSGRNMQKEIKFTTTMTERRFLHKRPCILVIYFIQILVPKGYFFLVGTKSARFTEYGRQLSSDSVQWG